MSGSSRKDVAGRRGGYTSLNLNQSYKGARPDGGRSYGKSHGLQSLGKVAATSRRIPGPASLPSLRSENAGNDPTVNLVPSGGGGWKNTKDNKENRVNNEPQSDKKEPKLRPQTPPSRQQRQQQQQQKHPPSPGRKFKAEFPSLEEQESMSKRELEELERRQRDEGRDGDRERSPERNSRPPGDRDRGWRDPPSGPPHGHHGPPPPNMGPYPPRGPYPMPPYHPPYMMHPPPRPGMAPYGGPPMAGPGGRYPPPPHVHYRPPYLHNYPPPNPYEMPDPYKMPPRKGDKGEEVSRPPTVKADDLKSMDMPDDEEGGWAGHHEEVDYTKEVVFEDSSDDEPTGRSPSGGEKRGRSSPRKKKKETTAADKDRESEPSERQDRADPEADSEYPRERDQERERERDFDRDPRRSEGGREGRGPPGGGPRPLHPPYPPYPSYSYQYDPYRYPQQPYPPHPGHYPMHPQSNYPPPPHSHSQRYGHQRGAKRGPPDREWDRDKDDSSWRHDFHPWSQHEEHRPKRRWSGGEEWTDERERPRILAKPDERKDSRKTSEVRDEPFSSEIEKGKEKSGSVKRTDSASPDDGTQEGSGKPRVTFASDSREKSQSPQLEDQPSSPAAKPAMRNAHPKKIMLRKLGGAESPTEKQDQHGAAVKGTKKERPKDLKNLRQGDASDAVDTDSPNTPDNEAKIKQTAWSVRERGPITSPKTLYEPDGKRSAAKFLKYRRERVSGASAGKGGESGSRGASSPSTPSPDVKVLPKEEEGSQRGEDEKEATDGVQAASPAFVEQESDQPAPEGVAEQKKEAPDRPNRPPRQDSGRQLHERERNTQDSREPRDRGRHRREEGREKGGPRRQDTREELQEPAKDRDNKDGRARDGRDERERQAHGRKGGGDYDSGREKGGFPTREFSRHGRGDRGRGEHPGRKQQDAAQGAAQERREAADRRRDHPNEPRPTAHKDQNQPDRTARGEAHPSRPEPARGDGRPRREDRRPREKQERQFRSAAHEHQDSRPVEFPPSSANTAPEQQTAASKNQSGEAGKPAVSETSTRAAEKAERVEPHGPVASGPNARTVPEHVEQKDHPKQPRDGRRDDRRPERASDRQRGGQRGAAGDRERGERGGRNPQRDREKGERDRDRGRPVGEDRERERGGKPSAERDRGERDGRPLGRHPPKDRSTEHPERGGRSNVDRRPARDSRRADQGERGERRERFGGRQRERGGPPGGRRMPPKGQQERAPERTHRTDRAAEPQKGTAKPGVVYSELEDIESGSDWEDDIETIDAATGTSKRDEQQSEPLNEKQPLKDAEGKTGSAPQSGKPHQAERSQRSENGRDSRRGGGVGRGKGRSGEESRRGREPGRPGSYSSQRRQGGSRDNSRGVEKQTAAESGGVSTAASRESADGKSKDRAPHSEKRSRDTTPQPSHKVPDFDKYDLNSHKVAIVDDIGSEGAEAGRFSPSVQGEFVEVTSKKAQKEKLKKEKEEQRRLDEEKRKLEEERLRRTKKLASNRPAANQDKNLPSPQKPVNAWGSNGTKSETEIGSVWASASDWLMLSTSAAAPGSQLKSPGLGDSRWPPGTAAAAANSIGVIGDSLQLKQLVSPGNALNSYSTAADNHTYSLFGSTNPIPSPFLGTPAIPSGSSGGSMLKAAVESTVPKLSQEALAGVSSEELEAPFPLSDEDQVGDEAKEKGKESPEFQKVERNRRGGKNLPPRFQSSKGQPSGPGRGRGSGSGGKGGEEASDRFNAHPKGRGGDRGPRSGDRGEKRHPQGSKPTPRQPSSAGATKGSEKTPSDRFYVPPRTRGERDQSRGQKSSGDRRHPPAPKPTPKPPQPQPQHQSQLTADSAKQSKVVNTGHGGGPKASSPVPSVEGGPLIDHSHLPLEERGSAAAGQQQLRAGRNAAAAARRQGEDRGKSKTGDSFPKTHAQVVVAGLGPRNQAQNQHWNRSDGGSSPDCGGRAVISEVEISQSLHAKEGQNEAVLVHLEQGEVAGSLRKHTDDLPPPRDSRPNGLPNLTAGGKNSQRSRPASGSSASTKTISYAQALKADLSTVDTGSKLSSRSQTPSDSSAFQSLSRSQGSSRASTPAGFRRPVQAQLAESSRLSREHDGRSQSAQSGSTSDAVAVSTVGGAGNESVEASQSGRTSREDASSVSRLTPDPVATTAAHASAHSKADPVSEQVVPEEDARSGEKDAGHQTKDVSRPEETEDQLPAGKEVKSTAAVVTPAEIQKQERRVMPVGSSEPPSSGIEATVIGPTTAAASHASVGAEHQAQKPPPGLSLNRAHYQSDTQTSGQAAVVLPVDRELLHHVASISNQSLVSMPQTAPPQSTSQATSNPFHTSQTQQPQPQEPLNPPTSRAMPPAPSRPDALCQVYMPELLASSTQHPGFEKPSPPSQPHARPPQPTQELLYNQRTAVPSNQITMLPRQQGMRQPAKLIQEYAVSRQVQLQHEVLQPGGAKQLQQLHQKHQALHQQHHQKPVLIPPHALRPADLEKDPRPEKFSSVPAPGSSVIRPSPSSPTATAVRSSPLMAGNPTSLQTRNPTHFASSAFTPYSRVNMPVVHVPTTRPSSAGHLQGHALQFSSASPQPPVDWLASQGSPKRGISQAAAQQQQQHQSVEREDREQSADSSKSSLSVAALPFVPSSGAASASVPVSSGLPVKRRSTGSSMTSMEMSPAVPVAPVLPMHPPAGFDRPPPPQVRVPVPQHALLQRQQQLRASQPTVTAVSPNTAALLGHHHHQRLVTAPNAAPTMQTLLLVRPQMAHHHHHQLQQTALTNPPPLPHTLAVRQPPQHVRTTEGHTSAVQVISPQNPAHSKLLRNQHEMSILAGAVMLQRQHEGQASRKLSHPHGGEQLGRSTALQARGMPLQNVIQPSVLYSHHNQRIPVGATPSGSERQGYIPGQTVTNYNLPLQLAQQKAASANVQKRPLLPTPPGLPAFLRTVTPVPGQSWPTALLQHMHAGAVRSPYPHVQEQQQQQPKSSQY